LLIIAIFKLYSNCDTKEQFLTQYEFLISEIARVTKPGRITAVHCTDIFDNRCYLWDFPAEIIKLHEKHGFHYRNRITIWKEPLKVRMRTMVQSLMHKFIVEDSTKCFTAMPDYMLIFTKKGDNLIPVTHEFGFTRYFGETPILKNILNAFNNAEIGAGDFVAKTSASIDKALKEGQITDVIARQLQVAVAGTPAEDFEEAL